MMDIVSIGEQLAEARRRAGLSVAEVSQRTRIRQTIIRAIERDDFSECGGDFYARGFIRSLAIAARADPEPLIGAYDATHRAPAPPQDTDLYLQLTGPALRERRRLNVTGLLAIALVIAVGLVAYRFIAVGGHAPRARNVPAARLQSGRHHAVLPRTPTPSSAPAARLLVVQLRASEDCWVEFTTASGGHLFQAYVTAGTSRRWTFKYGVHMRLGNPGGVKLRVNGANPLPPGISHPITLTLTHSGTTG